MGFKRLTSEMETSSRAGSAPAGNLANTGLGVIAVSGGDAASFLQAQLTNDVARLGVNEGRLTAWCDAKGRVQAVVWVLFWDEEYLLLLPRDLVAPVLQRLRLFVLRARVTLRDAGLVVRGLLGGDLSRTPLQRLPSGGVARDDGRLYLALPGPQPHGLVIAPSGPDTPHADTVEWRRAEVLAGLPQIYPETQGRFVPQMLNLHWLGGIDFHKGCYPGQEVVARLQYRGRLTRRMYRGVLDAGRTPVPGTPVTDAGGAEQGLVVEAAPGPDGQDLLAVLRIDATDSPLRVDGAELTLVPLPYPTEK